MTLTASAITATKVMPGWNERMRTPEMAGLAGGLMIIALII